MEVLKIEGESCLKGTVRISGAKNACLPIFAACLLTEDKVRIENVPDLSDVRFMAEIIESLGAKVQFLGEGTWEIEAKNITTHKAPYELVRKMRASICLMGPLVGRLGQAEISLPGGCVFGQRPIDLHLRGLEKLGCQVEIKNGYICIEGHTRNGQNIFLGGRHGSTVTGTANLLMAAVLTPGKTLIDSAACEPEIVDLCHMLVSMGANIKGIGTHSIVIEGVERLHGCHFKVIGDRIEAGTYVIAGLIPGNDITIYGLNRTHLAALFHLFEGSDISFLADGGIRVRGHTECLTPKEIVTLPYPGFPTDIQAQITTLLAITPGISIITEKIYSSRFMHVPELQRMGAHISVEGPNAIINGQPSLSGAPVMASDLRASMALVLAGTLAKGETWVQRIYHLDRGYENIDQKLRQLGANIERLPFDEMKRQLALTPLETAALL